MAGLGARVALQLRGVLARAAQLLPLLGNNRVEIARLSEVHRTNLAEFTGVDHQVTLDGTGHGRLLDGHFVEIPATDAARHIDAARRNQRLVDAHMT